MTLYADDMLLYRQVESPQDYQKLQDDIHSILEWVSANHLHLNVSKCKTMLISRKRTRLEPPPLLMNGHALEQVECFKYLGLFLASDLSWSPHIETACSKARKLLGMIYRRFSKHSSPDTLLHLYESMVCPHLEYASQVWDPYLQKDIKLLEGVQKFALRVCSKIYDNSYEDLLDTFQLPELSTRRLYLRLSLLFKIVHESYHFPSNIFIPMSSTLHYAKPYMYRQPFAHTNSFFYSFVPRTISDCNALPSYVTNTTSPASFKNAFISTLS